MKKPKKSSMPFVTIAVSNVDRVQLTSRYCSPEILSQMRICEAREWLSRYRKKIGEVGSVNGQSWWAQVKVDIARIRGSEALEELVNNMRSERDKEKKNGRAK